ncbi:MAG: hypothetical protein ACI9K5_003156 [Gammaproteobacteria bacterium]|jgi:hypothetical protein
MLLLPLALALLCPAPDFPGQAPSSVPQADALTAGPVTDQSPSLGQLVGAVSVQIPGGEERRLASLTPEKSNGAQPWVLTYSGVDCPISGKYAARVQSMATEFGARGVPFIGINANPQDSIESVVAEAAELGLTLPLVKDVRQEVTRILGTTTTTEVFLFGADGELVYRGAIDDQYNLGAARPAPTENYLREALESVLGETTTETAETAAPGCKLTLLEQSELPGTVTWSKDIAAIVAENCETCHRPGQVGPFSLQTYERTKGWAAMIAEVVTEGRMPPWNAAPAFNGHFQNERRLSKSEKSKLLRWIEDDMPRGNPVEDPAARQWNSDWAIGEPDVIFEVQRVLEELDKQGELLPSAGFAVPRDGTVEYQYFSVRTNYTEDRWIRALQIQPGAADVVHHVLVLCDDPSLPMEARRENLEFNSFLAGYAPGDLPAVYPDGYGKRLPAGANLIFQLHYTPNGKERFDRSRLGLVFWDEKPIFEVITDSVINEDFVVPAGAENFEVRAEKLIDDETGILLLVPHMHTRGKDFRFIAHYPDGGSEELLSVEYDFNWQESYLLYDPILLPGGTRLECIGHFDNSDQNPNNPDSTVEVRFGEQTWHEMFIGFYDKVVFVD